MSRNSTKATAPHKKAELNNFETKYKAILDSINDAVFIHDPDTGAILVVNRKMTEMYGYTADEVRLLNIADISSGIAPYNDEGGLEKVRTAVDLNGHIFEWQAKDKSGHIFWVEVSLKPAVIDGRNLIVATVRDINQRKHAEDELEAERARLEATLNSMPLAIWITDPTGRVVKTNEQTNAIWGESSHPAESMEEYSTYKGWRPDTGVPLRAEDWAAARALTKGEIIVGEEVNIQRFDGSFGTALNNAAPIRDDEGSIIGAVVIEQDITERKKTEKALLQSQKRFNAFMDNVPSLVIIKDHELRPVYFNKSYREMFPADQWMGKTPEETFPADIASRMREQDTLALVTGSVQYEESWTDKNGRSHIFETRKFRIDHEDSSPLLAAVINDITERKQVEDALQKSEEEYRLIVEHAPAAIYELDYAGPRFKRVNEAMCQILGYTREELLKTNPMDLLDEESRIRFKERILKVLGGEEIDENVSFRVITREGRSIWANLNVKIEYEEGRPAGALVIAHDLTERKRIEDALRESEEKFKVISDASPAAVFVYRGERHLYVNQAAVSIFGYTREELLEMNFIDHMDPDYRDMARKWVTARMKGYNKPERYEMKIITKSGEEKYLDVSSGLISYEGTQAGIVVGIDITKRKQAEEELLKYREKLEDLVKERTVELEEKNRKLKEEIAEREKAEGDKQKVETQLAQAQRIEAIDRFAGGIAHDLNNILYPIIINTEELLAEEPMGSVRHGILDQTLKAAYRQRDLVKKILSFSRRTEQVRQPVQLKPLLEETVTFLKSSLPSTIEIRQNISVKDNAILGDPIQIQQVIMNLCQNAADAYQSEKGVIEVGLANTRMRFSHDHQNIRSGDYLKLTVKDSGTGIPSGIMDRIFEPFFTSKGIGKGTGMGLSVVYGIVKSHEGTITVESEEGKGSLFTVYFPVLEVYYQEQASSTESPPAVQGKGKILLIDDEELVLSSLQRVLKSSGYDIAACRDSSEAFDVFAQKPDEFDLIITDLTMPGMTGLELSKKIQSLRSDIPIVLCTGFNDIINQEEAQSFGVKELLLKPVGAGELKKVIRRALEQ